MHRALSDRAQIVDCLHRSRLDPYLEETGQNEKRALALYRWNVQLAAAFQELLSVTEIVLRNAMDRELQTWNTQQLATSQSWLLSDPAAPLRSLSAGKRTQALGLAAKVASKRDSKHRRHGHPVTHDDVLAQITFGLWKDLLPNHDPGAGDNTTNSNRERMWNEALVKAFPHAADSDGEATFWRVYRLHHLRNRVSHMENLLATDTRERTRDIFQLVASINPSAEKWLTGINRVPVVVKTRPE